MTHVAIQLSCYNGARYLPRVLASLRGQTFRDWTLYVTDNASEPAQAETIEASVQEFGSQAVFVSVGPKNIDFVGAHNLLFSKHAAPLVLLMNDDAILEPDYLEHLVAAFEADPKLGSASGRIYRWDFAQSETASGGRTHVIDSFGLAMDVAGRVSDIGAGETVSSGLLHDGAHEVFGVSGCVPMYRRSAVLAASLDGQLFDTSFVSYKEDVDLAWRLRRAGSTSAVISKAVAYHRRSFGSVSRSPAVRAAYPWRPLFHSYRNHLWMLAYHLPLFKRGGQGEFDSPARAWAVIPYELAKAGYWLFARPEVFVRAWNETWKRRKELIAKREQYRLLFTSQLPTTSYQLPSTPHFDISVVIVCHNDLSTECLASLDRARKASGLKVGVTIVDNDSYAIDAPRVAWSVLPDAAIVQRNWDAGYGSSVNRGSCELEADYLFILNPDTVLTDDQIFTKLVAFMKSHPAAGIAAPKLLHADGHLQETFYRFPGWLVPLLQRTNLAETEYGKKYLRRYLLRDVPRDQTRMIDWAQGSALFLPMEHWIALGGFDELFWMYCEDTDLCRRSWKLHRPVYYVPDAVLQHAHGKESKRQGSLLSTILKNRMAWVHVWSFIKYKFKWRQDWFRPQPRS